MGGAAPSSSSTAAGGRLRDAGGSAAEEKGARHLCAEVVPPEPVLTGEDLRFLDALRADGWERDARPPGRFREQLGEGYYSPHVLARGEPYGMNADETAVVAGYCGMEDKVINQPLRDEVDLRSHPVGPLIEVLDRALEKLPPAPGQVYRVELAGGEAPSYVEGQPVLLKGVVSTSKRIRDIPSDDDTPILNLYILQYSGRDVSGVSGYPIEKEVLLPHGRWFMPGPLELGAPDAEGSRSRRQVLTELGEEDQERLSAARARRSP